MLWRGDIMGGRVSARRVEAETRDVRVAWAAVISSECKGTAGVEMTWCQAENGGGPRLTRGYRGGRERESEHE